MVVELLPSPPLAGEGGRRGDRVGEGESASKEAKSLPREMVSLPTPLVSKETFIFPSTQPGSSVMKSLAHSTTPMCNAVHH